MICQECKKDFPEKEIEESHNAPTYLFQGEYKKQRKQQADKFGRKALCIDCHDKYEAMILQILYRNLLRKDIELVVGRIERIPYFPKLWRLPEHKKKIGIKICQKINSGDYNGTII